MAAPSADPAAELADAERELAENAELVAVVEQKLASGKNVPADRYHELQDLQRFGRLRVDGIRERITAAEREKRLAALRDLAAEVTAFADEGPSTAIPDALRDLAAAAALVRSLTAAHDRRAGDWADRAVQLGAEGPGPSGRPRASSAGVAVGGSSRNAGRQVTAGFVSVGQVGELAEDAITDAVAGHPDEAVTLVSGAVTRLSNARSPHYLINAASGLVIAAGDPVPPALAAQVRSGGLRELRRREIDRYLAGEDIDDAG